MTPEQVTEFLVGMAPSVDIWATWERLFKRLAFGGVPPPELMYLEGAWNGCRQVHWFEAADTRTGYDILAVLALPPTAGDACIAIAEDKYLQGEAAIEALIRVFER